MKAFFDSILRIMALVHKEVMGIITDRRAVQTLMIPPIMQCFIFGYAASYDLNNIPYGLYDRSDSMASHELVSRLDGTGLFHCVKVIRNEREMAQAVDNQDVIFVLGIGPDFEKKLESGGTTDVQVICDGRNSNTAGTALSYVNSAVRDFNQQWRSDHGMGGEALAVNDRAWFNPNLETRWSMIPGLIGTLTLLQTLLLAARSVAKEREQGTFDQLLVTPLRPYEIMIGKTVPCLMVGFLQATGVLLVAQLWFRIPFAGTLLPLYAGLLFFLLAAVGMGLFISSISKNLQQSMLYSFVFMMPFMILSGFTTPIANMPTLVQYLTLLNPLRYAVDIARRVYLDGAGVAQILPEIGALAALAAVTLTAAVWMFRRKLY